MFHSQLSPSRTIDWYFMHLDQERGSHEEIPARLEHCIRVLPRTVRPKQVLEHLVRDNQIESFRQRHGADVKIREIRLGKRLESQSAPDMTGRDFQRV